MEVIRVVPNTSDEWNWIWLGLGMLLVGAVGLFVFSSQRSSGRKHTEKALIQMLLFFVVLLGLASSGFSIWSLSRLKTVEISAEGLRYGEKLHLWRDVRQVYVREAETSNVLNTSQSSVRIVVIEPKEGKPILLSDKSYAASTILGGVKLYRPVE